MILEPGKLTVVRACFPIAIVILLATYACIGGPISDTPSANPMGGAQVDAGRGSPEDEEDGSLDGAGSNDAGSWAGELDAAAAAMDAGSPTASPCSASDAGDAGQADGEASVDGAVDLGDAAIDAGDSGADADAANDAQVDADANFPDAAGDAQLPLSDASSDAPYMPSTSDACVP